jgi:hypothetical protein
LSRVADILSNASGTASPSLSSRLPDDVANTVNHCVAVWYRTASLVKYFLSFVVLRTIVCVYIFFFFLHRDCCLGKSQRKTETKTRR